MQLRSLETVLHYNFKWMDSGRGSLATLGSKKRRPEFQDWKTGEKEFLRFFWIKKPFENEMRVMHSLSSRRTKIVSFALWLPHRSIPHFRLPSEVWVLEVPFPQVDKCLTGAAPTTKG